MAYIIEAPPILINAPQERVWAILTDLKGYAHWNPMTPQIDGELRLGAPILIYARLRDRFTTKQPETVTDFEPMHRIGWRPRYPAFLLKAKRLQIIEPAGPGQTRYHTYERFSGLLAWLVIRLYGKDIERGFRNMAEALKKKSEHAD